MPSNLCLDAPLVAVGWALLIGIATVGDYPPPHRTGGLFFAVWAIYLFDRIYDSYRSPLNDTTPSRHAFAGNHRWVLLVLIAVSIVGGVFVVFPHLNTGLIKSAVFPGALCLTYFLVFRFLRNSKSDERKRSPFPAKEMVIGWCFASGVMIAAVSQFLAVSGILIEIALTCLFAGNCLIISRAECEFDREADNASFYSKSKAANWVPLVLLSITSLIGVLSLILNLFPAVGIAILICALIEFGIKRHASKAWAQPLADGALLFPWVMLLFLG